MERKTGIPKWARWCATDKNGETRWYEYEPSIHETRWCQSSAGGRVVVATIDNWEHSKQRVAECGHNNKQKEEKPITQDNTAKVVDTMTGLTADEIRKLSREERAKLFLKLLDRLECELNVSLEQQATSEYSCVGELHISEDSDLKSADYHPVLWTENGCVFVVKM